MTKNLISIKGVSGKVGLSRGSIYVYMNAGTFPRSIKIGPRRVAWIEQEIDEWIMQRASAQ